MSQLFTSPKGWVASWVLASLLLAFAARAQQAAAPDTSGTARQYAYALPEVPALAFIGAGSPQITRPVMPRALATKLVNGIDSAGRVKQGLAIAVAPWALLGRAVTVASYQHNYRQYLASNTQLSLGTVRVAGDAAATDLGLGLRVTLFDGSDPMRSSAFTDTIRALLLRSLPTYDPQDVAAAPAIITRLQLQVKQAVRAQAVADSLKALATGAAVKPAATAATAAAATTAAANAKLATAQQQVTLLQLQVSIDTQKQLAATNSIARYRQNWVKSHWSAPSITVAGAMGWRLNDSRLAPAPDNRQLGWSAWATGALPLAGSAGQLLGQVRYTYARQALTADAPTQADGQVLYGARAVFGSASLNFYAEVTGTSHSNPLPGTARVRSDWGGGIEFRTTEGMWVSAGFGHQLASSTGKPEAALLFAGIHWQIASAARFAPAAQP